MSHELEETDTMFSVRLPPWHGLGTVLEDNPTPEEAIEHAGLDWMVEGRPVYHIEDGEGSLHGRTADDYVRVEGYQAITRVTDGEVYAILKDTYTPFQNREAFAWVTPLVESGLVVLETAGSLANGKRVWIMARVVGAEEEVRDNDVVRQYVLLANSHDGGMSVRNGFCATRVVCGNTLRMAEDEGGLNRIRHSGNMKVRLDVAREVIEGNIHKFRESIGLARLMADKEVTAELLVGYIRKVFVTETEEQLQKRVDLIMPLFEGGQGNGQGSLWDLYNAVTEWLNYQRGKNQDTRLDSLWFGEGAKISDRAWGNAVKLVAEMVDDGEDEGA